MSDSNAELLSIADKLDETINKSKEPRFQEPLSSLEKVVERISKSWSGSSLGYHAYVYYAEFKTPPARAHFSSEWGLMDVMIQDTTGDWREFDPDVVKNFIFNEAGNPDLSDIEILSQEAAHLFEQEQSEVLSIISNEISDHNDSFLLDIKRQVEEISIPTGHGVINNLVATGQVMTRDTIAMGQGRKSPPHAKILRDLIIFRAPINACKSLESLARKAGSHLSRKTRKKSRVDMIGTNIFIGHGRSLLWKDLKEFVQDRLHLPWDEFNRVPVAGITNISRLSEMLDSAAIAFLVMTGEDEQLDGKLHARLNVVHEAGLFQGRLGFTRAIVLLEEGCEDFSNIHGLGQIRFPKGDIGAAFEDIRAVLEREGIIASNTEAA